MEEQSDLTKEEIIERLGNINKEELSERQFFQAIITEVNKFKGKQLSYEDCEKISEKIEQIGCTDFKTWAEEKMCEGKIVKDSRIIAGVRNGSIVMGAAFVGDLIDKKDIVMSAINSRTGSCVADPERKANMYEVWLKNSQRIIDENREDEWLVDISEEVLDQNREAIARIKGRIEEKREITKEIEDIESQIERLKAELSNKKSRLRQIKEEDSKEELKIYG